jgi:hypothetical protein
MAFSSQASNEDNIDIQKINNNIFIFKYDEKIYFVMEKIVGYSKEWFDYYNDQVKKISEINAENSNIINKFKKENTVYKKVKELEESELSDSYTGKSSQEILDESLKENKKFQKNKKLTLSKGPLNCFKDSLDYANKESLKENSDFETWVAYVVYSKKAPQDFYNNETDRTKVVMAMATSTAKDIPFIFNMGIARAPIFFKESPVKIPSISVALHAFAAAVMKNQYSSKEYMITVPAPSAKGQESMESILKKTFKNDTQAFWSGDNIDDLTSEVHPAVIVKENFENQRNTCNLSNEKAKWRLKSKDGYTYILNLTPQDMKKNSWFFCHPCAYATTTRKTEMGITPGLHYITVDIDKLIRLLSKL